MKSFVINIDRLDYNPNTGELKAKKGYGILNGDFKGNHYAMGVELPLMILETVQLINTMYKNL